MGGWDPSFKFPCPVESQNHELYQCSLFLGMTPKERHEKLRGKICKTCLKPGGICVIKGRKWGTKVPKSLLCNSCIQFIQSKNLSPFNILYCTSERPEHVHPPKPKFFQAMQEYFGGKITGEITPETVCYGVYVSSWIEKQVSSQL